MATVAQYQEQIRNKEKQIKNTILRNPELLDKTSFKEISDLED